MSRPAHQHGLVRWSLPGTIALLAILSLLPFNAIGFLGWFSELVLTVEAPISHPIASVATRFTPGSTVGPSDPRLLELEQQRDQIEFAYLQAQDEIERLYRRVDELSLTTESYGSVPVRQLSRSRIGSSGSMLIIRSGAGDGTIEGTVVTTSGMQIVGRVVEVQPLQSLVLPITDLATPAIEGTILLTLDGSRRRRCLLRPTGDGLLRGDVENETGVLAGEDPIPLAPGDVVRLDDDQWPRHAHRLVIGKIERIEVDDELGLRRVITVRPTANLQRVSDVIVRIPVETPARSSTGVAP